MLRNKNVNNGERSRLANGMIKKEELNIMQVSYNHSSYDQIPRDTHRDQSHIEIHLIHMAR